MTVRPSPEPEVGRNHPYAPLRVPFRGQPPHQALRI